jgi:hypothetical protein
MQSSVALRSAHEGNQSGQSEEAEALLLAVIRADRLFDELWNETPAADLGLGPLTCIVAS